MIKHLLKGKQMGNVTEDGLDKEGKEVLDELEKEGFEIAGREKPADTPPAAEVIPPLDKTKADDKPADLPKQPDKPADTPPAKTDEPVKERKVQHVPLKKYLETEDQLKEAKAKIEELTKSSPDAKPSEAKIADATTAVKELVDKFGYDEEDAKKMVDVFKHLIPGQTISPEIQRALDALPALDKIKADLESQQDAVLFEKDFIASVIKDFPHLEKYKDQIKEMAYSEEYTKTPLRSVALIFMDQEGISASAKDVLTSEKSGGGTNKGVVEIDFANITDEQFAKLTPEQQDQFFAYQEQKEKKARGALN